MFQRTLERRLPPPPTTHSQCHSLVRFQNFNFQGFFVGKPARKTGPLIRMCIYHFPAAPVLRNVEIFWRLKPLCRRRRFLRAENALILEINALEEEEEEPPPPPLELHFEAAVCAVFGQRKWRVPKCHRAPFFPLTHIKTLLSNNEH